MRGLRQLVGAGLLVTACVDEPMQDNPDDPVHGPDFEVRYETEYVDVAPGFTQPVCRGSLEEIDRHVEAVAELLNIDVQQRTTLYWYNENATGALVENAEIGEWCSSGGGCYLNGVVHANLGSLHHELVHAVVTPAWGRSDSFFSEGIAGGLDRVLGAAGSGVTIHPVMGSENPLEIAGSGLHSDGHFVRWLVDRFGADMFQQLWPPLTASPTKEEVFAAVEDVYGLPFEELYAEYLATAPTIYPLPGLCEGLPIVPWNGDRWELDLTADCDAPYTFGPQDDGDMFVVALIDIPTEFDGVPLASWIPSDEHATVWPCIAEPLYDADPEIVRINGIDNNGPTTFRTSGPHRIELPVQESGDVYLRLCPDNGLFPGAYPLDKTVDPENCL